LKEPVARPEAGKRGLLKSAIRIFLDICAKYRRDASGSELDIIDYLATCRLLEFTWPSLCK
jgi:hypothetical protein